MMNIEFNEGDLVMYVAQNHSVVTVYGVVIEIRPIVFSKRGQVHDVPIYNIRWSDCTTSWYYGKDLRLICAGFKDLYDLTTECVSV